jgi:hypothetical protein
MSDVSIPEIPETDEDVLRDVGDRFLLPYDDVFLPDGSLLEPMDVGADFD